MVFDKYIAWGSLKCERVFGNLNPFVTKMFSFYVLMRDAFLSKHAGLMYFS